MKKSFVELSSEQVLRMVKLSMLQVAGIAVFMPHMLFCWPSWSQTPGLPLVTTACESAQKTVSTIALRGMAKVIDTSNEHKVFGVAIVGLAAVGAGYILTRPYVWANERTEKEKCQANERAEKEKYRADLEEAKRLAAEKQALLAESNAKNQTLLAEYACLNEKKELLEKRLEWNQNCLRAKDVRDDLENLLAQNKLDSQKIKDQIRTTKRGIDNLEEGYTELVAELHSLERKYGELKDTFEHDNSQTRYEQELLHFLFLQMGAVTEDGKTDAKEILRNFVLSAYGEKSSIVGKNVQRSVSE